jgi:alkylation response protein AidB-like acyl-CoA dehydrogenase
MKANETVLSVALNGLHEMAAEIGPLLAEEVDNENASRRISQRSLGALREGGFLRLFLPKSLGGLEADPLTVAQLVEEISRYNAAAGWTMMVANVSAWWCGKLPERGIEEIYENGPDTLMAGAFHPPMRATPVKGGYRVNGRSPLTSNVHEAQWIFVTAFVMNEDQIAMNDGVPVVRGFAMNAKDVNILDTWHTFGMRATDSNDIEANDVFVPEHRSFILMPGFQPNQYYHSPLYQFPAIGAGIACLISPVAIAVAGNAINELKSLAGRKVPFGSMVSMCEKGTVQRKLGLAEALVQSSRAYLHETISGTWKTLQSGNVVSLEEKATMLLASTHTNQSCLQAVDLVYSACGSSAIYTRNKISVHFANAQVIRQHGFANDSRYETAAQVYLGMMPDLPVVAF